MRAAHERFLQKKTVKYYREAEKSGIRVGACV